MSKYGSSRWWLNLFTGLITIFAFMFVIMWVFFVVRGDWAFLTELDFYSKTIITTMLAFILRWFWHRIGRDKAREEKEIATLENNKQERISKISQNDALDKLKQEAEEYSLNNKALAYRDKCDFKLMRIATLKEKWYYKIYHKVIKLIFKTTDKSEFWAKQKLLTTQWVEGDKGAINIKNIRRVKYYSVTASQLLTIDNEYAPAHSVLRANSARQILHSYTLNALTVMSYAFLYGFELITQPFTLEAVLLMIVQTLILTTNIGMGVYLGQKFIKSDYKRDIVDDISFLDGFLRKQKMSIRGDQNKSVA